jgi:multiple sugar transport system ATP-binding protein
MDEPLSNLDALLRLEMRAELKSLLATLGATTIYVTHDQIEAMSMGDRIAVMRSGKLLQMNSPMALYDQPANLFVGSFIGNPPMNFMTGQVQCTNGKPMVQIGEFALELPADLQTVLRTYDGKVVDVGIRAENIDTLAEPAQAALPVTVQVVEPLGSQNLLTIKVGSDTIKVATHPDFPARAGGTVWLRIPPQKIRLLNRDTGEAIMALSEAEKAFAQ